MTGRNKDLTDNRPERGKGIQELVNRLALLKVSRNNPNNRSKKKIHQRRKQTSGWLGLLFMKPMTGRNKDSLSSHRHAIPRLVLAMRSDKPADRSSRFHG